MERERRTDGYGSKWKKWALVYLGVAAVVYLVIYLAVSSGGGYGSQPRRVASGDLKEK